MSVQEIYSLLFQSTSNIIKLLLMGFFRFVGERDNSSCSLNNLN